MPKTLEAPLEKRVTKTAKTPAAPPAPEPEYVTSAQLAAQIGIKSTILRRWLRTLEQYQDGGYTRYKWEADDPFLADAQLHYEQFAQAEADKQAKRTADAQEKAAKKKAAADSKPVKKTSKTSAVAEPEEEGEEEIFDEDETEEELE